jgi:hypothetical protein
MDFYARGFNQSKVVIIFKPGISHYIIWGQPSYQQDQISWFGGDLHVTFLLQISTHVGL